MSRLQRNRCFGIVALLMWWTCGHRPAHGQSSPRDVLSPPGQQLLVLKQNWSESEARSFYSAAQGSHLLP